MEAGGMAMPRFRLYIWALQLPSILFSLVVSSTSTSLQISCRNTPYLLIIYMSFNASSILLCLSSHALVFLGPHLAIVASSFCLSFSFFSGASQIIITNLLAQLNFFPNLKVVHLSGSVVRSLRISAISSSFRWCRTASGLNFSIIGGRFDWEARLATTAENNPFRLSSFGMKRSGVW